MPYKHFPTTTPCDTISRPPSPSLRSPYIYSYVAIHKIALAVPAASFILCVLTKDPPWTNSVT